MSRTDAHAPLHVRLARGDLSAQPFHAPGHNGCDLPIRPQTVRNAWQPATRCFWGYVYTGVHECPCHNGHAGRQAPALNRAERHRDRAALGAALGAWRGGDDTAFDALVPPARGR